MIFKRLILIGLSILSMNACASSPWLENLIEQKKGNSIGKPLLQTTKKGFFAQHTVLFFYSSQCPHCHHLAPVLKAWQLRTNASIAALSFDNQPITGFESFMPVTTEWVNAAFLNKPITYPALFMVNTKTKVIYPIAYGSMSEIELDARFKSLIPKIIAHESKGASV